jgi:hypothetical protein
MNKTLLLSVLLFAIVASTFAHDKKKHSTDVEVVINMGDHTSHKDHHKDAKDAANATNSS